MVIRDFNCVLFPEERIGCTVAPSEVSSFQYCVTTCELSVMKSQGCVFTWNNKKEGTQRVFTKFDRALVNASWMHIFPGAVAHFLPE